MLGLNSRVVKQPVDWPRCGHYGLFAVAHTSAHWSRILLSYPDLYSLFPRLYPSLHRQYTSLAYLRCSGSFLFSTSLSYSSQELLILLLGRCCCRLLLDLALRELLSLCSWSSSSSSYFSYSSSVAFREDSRVLRSRLSLFPS